MAKTKYAVLVEAAQQKLQHHRHIVLDSIALEEGFKTDAPLHRLAKELDVINKHITVDPEIFKEAAEDYSKIAEHLVEKLHWSNDDIRIIPQGSSRTKTLIRSPDASKFDIDAVCAVDISRIEANNPMGFFDKIGDALTDWKPDAKKRCWCVDFPNRRYYIEFTPSVPLNTVPQHMVDGIRYRPSNLYSDTALAVVDTPTKKWKTSNPEGFAQWVADQAERRILMSLALEGRTFDSLASNSIESVPEQVVPLSDTLRIAIRLLKRHRDMSVRRGYIESEVRPISVIIVTLLTQCYEGLADQGQRYTHPFKLLVNLVQLMPLMIENRNGEYWIENPTVNGENFAEKWKVNPALKKAFDNWCELLVEDLQHLLSVKDERLLSDKLREVFGSTGAAGVVSTPSGLTSRAPSRVHAVPATRGLA